MNRTAAWLGLFFLCISLGCNSTIDLHVQVFNNCPNNVTVSALDKDGNPAGETFTLVTNTNTTFDVSEMPSKPEFAQIDPATKEVLQKCLVEGAKNNCWVIVTIDQNCNIQCSLSSCAREPGLQPIAEEASRWVQDIDLIRSVSHGINGQSDRPCDCKKK